MKYNFRRFVVLTQFAELIIGRATDGQRGRNHNIIEAWMVHHKRSIAFVSSFLSSRLTILCLSVAEANDFCIKVIDFDLDKQKASTELSESGLDSSFIRNQTET